MLSNCRQTTSSNHYSVGKTRPKSLLVFINPHGGKKRAKVVFEEKVAPLFDLAGITSHVIGKYASDGLVMIDL